MTLCLPAIASVLLLPVAIVPRYTPAEARIDAFEAMPMPNFG